jgi:hypothetical protein
MQGHAAALKNCNTQWSTQVMLLEVEKNKQEVTIGDKSG